MTPAPLTKPTGAQLVYEALLRAIISLELPPGSMLEEQQLCRQYKVSRTPVREALIRLAADGLAEVSPNRAARVAPLGFAEVVDHYEAMDIFMPLACHFAAVRRTPEDLAALKARLGSFARAVREKDFEGMIRFNYELHSAIATACHNRCIERGYRQMLADKLRLPQHGLSGTTYTRGQALADRLVGTARISAKVVRAIEKGDGPGAERTARELNAFVRRQVTAVLSASLGRQVKIPQPARRMRA